MAPPVKIVDAIAPVRVTQPAPDVWLFDFGQNFVGWPVLTVDGTVPAGTTIETYGDTQTMARYYPQMQAFLYYIRTQKAGTGASAFIVDAALADWAAADSTTSGRITGTWAYHQVADRMSRIATLIGRDADALEYRTLAANIQDAFNAAFYNAALGRYTTDGNLGTTGATQAAQALALDEGLVPDGERQRVLDALVELIASYHPSGGGPHLSGGTIGLAPTVRALTNGGRDDVLWNVLQEDTQPSYGFFLASTAANPDGLAGSYVFTAHDPHAAR